MGLAPTLNSSERPRTWAHELGNHHTKRDGRINKLRVACFVLACFAASLFGEIVRAQDAVFFGDPPPLPAVQKRIQLPHQRPLHLRQASV